MISKQTQPFRKSSTEQRRPLGRRRGPDGSFRHSVSAAMLRDLDGRIRYWNKASERVYGWKRRQAEGATSHNLLRTIFPLPLQEINRELTLHGEWRGELIHSLSDGRFVKVASRWELLPDPEGGSCVVVETNEDLTPLQPDSAHLHIQQHAKEKLKQFFFRNWMWFLVPVIMILIMIELIIEMTALPL
jgi:PAS domain S-box-containing protein